MQLSSLESRIEELTIELAQYHGYRTLWLDRAGELRHAEPEDEFESLGWVYVASLMQPDAETVTAVVTRIVPLKTSSQASHDVMRWEMGTRAGMESVLVPAQVV